MSRYLQHARPIPRDSTVDPSDRRETTGAKHPYRVGRDYEQAVAGILQRRGWFTHRAYESKGVIDLFAFRKDSPNLWVQAKATGDIGSTEWNRVFELAETYGAWPVVAFRVGPREHAFYRLDEAREFRSHARPWTRFDPGTLEDIPAQLALAA